MKLRSSFHSDLPLNSQPTQLSDTQDVGRNMHVAASVSILSRVKATYELISKFRAMLNTYWIMLGIQQLE